MVPAAPVSRIRVWTRSGAVLWSQEGDMAISDVRPPSDFRVEPRGLGRGFDGLERTTSRLGVLHSGEQRIIDSLAGIMLPTIRVLAP